MPGSINEHQRQHPHLNIEAMFTQLIEGTAATRQAQRGRGGTHEGATGAPTLAINEALNLDDVQRVAHRHARHLVFLNQFPLGGKTVTRL